MLFKGQKFIFVSGLDFEIKDVQNVTYSVFRECYCFFLKK